MSRQILVALDTTPDGERVLPWVSRLARGCGASVHLVVIRLPVTGLVGRSSADFVDREIARVTDQELARLQVLAARFEDDGVPATTEMRFGEPAGTILTLARERGADLIAMGADPPIVPLAPWPHGVSGEVLRRAEVPVLIAPGGDRPAA